MLVKDANIKMQSQIQVIFTCTNVKKKSIFPFSRLIFTIFDCLIAEQIVAYFSIIFKQLDRSTYFPVIILSQAGSITVAFWHAESQDLQHSIQTCDLWLVFWWCLVEHIWISSSVALFGLIWSEIQAAAPVTSGWSRNWGSEWHLGTTAGCNSRDFILSW